MNNNKNMTRGQLHSKKAKTKKKRGPILPRDSKSIFRKWWLWTFLTLIIVALSGVGISKAADARNQEEAAARTNKVSKSKPAKKTTQSKTKKTPKKKSVKPEVAKDETQENQNDQNADTNDNSNQNTDSQYYFKDNKAVIHDIDIEITQTKVIQPGDTGNENGKKPIFAIWYKTTNKTDKDINPTTAWVAIFKATQKSDNDEEKDLEVAAQPDSRFVDTQLNTINQGDTAESAVAYALEDTSKPVTLIATKGVNGETIGSQEYQVK
ncbi:DUF5067 domain-containing protein [Companilactobacillus baiquanensis]|uniref:DUF5067 domain-containing protein n=1 Tax=Companilactobacillus baiquanensis TaxID=2486005 RepID=A0ABW1UVM9_9LACO|nr:DUF5067 domain-containing protein [Companilactobacillus baiquanensis]